MKVCIALGTLHAGLVPGQEPESPWAISHPRDTTSGNKVPKHPLPAEIRRSGEFQALHMVSLSSLLSCGRGSGRADPTALGGLGQAAWLPPSRSPSGAGAGGAQCTWRASAPRVLGPCVCAGLSRGALGCQTRLRAPDGGQGGKCQPSLVFP